MKTVLQGVRGKRIGYGGYESGSLEELRSIGSSSSRLKLE